MIYLIQQPDPARQRQKFFLSGAVILANLVVGGRPIDNSPSPADAVQLNRESFLDLFYTQVHNFDTQVRPGRRVRGLSSCRYVAIQSPRCVATKALILHEWPDSTIHFISTQFSRKMFSFKMKVFQLLTESAAISSDAVAKWNRMEGFFGDFL